MNALSKELPIKQFQFVQKSLECIEARLVTEKPFSREEETQFVNAIHRRLQHKFDIEISYLDNISRSKSGKFEDFISEVAN
jgi:phenylacetate-CoA ligase